MLLNQTWKRIPKDGTLLLGQEPDAYLGGYDETQAFSGFITEVGLWNRALTGNEIHILSNCRDKAKFSSLHYVS